MWVCVCRYGVVFNVWLKYVLFCTLFSIACNQCTTLDEVKFISTHSILPERFQKLLCNPFVKLYTPDVHVCNTLQAAKLTYMQLSDFRASCL